jgi:hypothetical protein
MHTFSYVVNINVYPLTYESFFPNIFRQNKRMRRNSDGAMIAAVGGSEWERVCVCVCVQSANQKRRRESSRLSCSRTKLPKTQHTLRLFIKLIKYDWSTEQATSRRIHTGNSLLEAWVLILSSNTVLLNTNPGLCFTRSSAPYVQRSPQPIPTEATTEQLRIRTHNITIPTSSLTFL